MSVQEKMRRGTKAENDAFTGAEAETTYDTENNRQINHDGVKTGGFTVPIADDIRNQIFTSGDAVWDSVSAYNVTLYQAPDAYAEFQTFLIKPDTNNVGAVDINFNDLGDKNLQKYSNGSLSELDNDDMVANNFYIVSYDGFRFLLLGGIGGGGGYSLVSSTEISGSPQTIELDDIFESGKSYMILLSNVKSNSNSHLDIQLGTSGSSYTTAGYSYTAFGVNSAGSLSVTNSNSGSAIRATHVQISPSNNFNGVIHVQNPLAAEYTSIHGQLSCVQNTTTQNVVSQFGGEYRNAATGTASIRFDLESTNTFTSGQISVYQIDI